MCLCLWRVRGIGLGLGSALRQIMRQCQLVSIHSGLGLQVGLTNCASRFAGQKWRVCIVCLCRLTWQWLDLPLREGCGLVHGVIWLMAEACLVPGLCWRPQRWQSPRHNLLFNEITLAKSYIDPLLSGRLHAHHSNVQTALTRRCAQFSYQQ